MFKLNVKITTQVTTVMVHFEAPFLTFYFVIHKSNEGLERHEGEKIRK